MVRRAPRLNGLELLFDLAHSSNGVCVCAVLKYVEKVSVRTSLAMVSTASDVQYFLVYNGRTDENIYIYIYDLYLKCYKFT